MKKAVCIILMMLYGWDGIFSQHAILRRILLDALHHQKCTSNSNIASSDDYRPLWVKYKHFLEDESSTKDIFLQSNSIAAPTSFTQLHYFNIQPHGISQFSTLYLLRSPPSFLS
ncbi:MAG: hypothetical protein PHP42_11490 [Bacteroidota bacterium]|nr:hypothetical protein [Bacteroidota bacterium]